MTLWQRRARLGVAVFGIAFAIAVYAAIGERESADPLPRPERLDPLAVLESAGAAFQQFRDTRQDFIIEADRQLTYEDGATRFLGVTIKVRGREGRDFVVTGDEATAGGDREELDISGGVTLTASDGFVMTVERAEFSETDATVRTSGPVNFHKGGMAGSGVGMSYDRDRDVLAIAQQAEVAVTGAEGGVVMSFTAGSATLARQDDYLALDGDVHAVRGEQVLGADRGVARLTEDEEYITFIELRGNARVEGGGAFDAMSARDIDLDYTDDGATLERVRLEGEGAVAMAGQDGAAGRQFLGDTLDVSLAPDGTLTAVTGRGNVRVDLPGDTGRSRSIRAQGVDATGAPGRDLTAARFAGDVEYREEARGAEPRMAHSDELALALADDAITSAVFTGGVRFEEAGLQASAPVATYDPGGGRLRLSGAGTPGPRVADDQVAIEAQAIDVVLESRGMSARGGVKTVLQPRPAGGSRLPGLLQQGEPANVNADRLEYDGTAGTAVYEGGATLWQGDTAVRADTITIDRGSGDLMATGHARSTLTLDGELAVGNAARISYDDSTRRITYDSTAPAGGRPVGPTSVSPVGPTSVSPVGPTSGAVGPPSGGPVGPASVSQLNGPQGNLQARRIEVVLAKTGSHAERLEAYTGVEVRLDSRVATGDRLTYHADEERYVMSGIATVPVTVVDTCRETTGRTVTFFKSSDRIIVDGNEEVRTHSRRGAAPCPATPAR